MKNAAFCISAVVAINILFWDPILYFICVNIHYQTNVISFNIAGSVSLLIVTAAATINETSPLQTSMLPENETVD